MSGACNRQTRQAAGLTVAAPPTCANVTPGNPQGFNIISGTNRSDTLNGTPGPDAIFGLGGNDVINGLGGNDLTGLGWSCSRPRRGCRRCGCRELASSRIMAASGPPGRCMRIDGWP
ncbi:hypothetical protein [Streptomyces sp. Tue6028]|uniref:hypothetical protein n=1 Tax=Streptomyces sp. Tue6028 TaxID=2036037 RepID=UPI003EB7ECF3